MTEGGDGALITSAQTAQILGIDRSTLSRWVASGRIEPDRQLANGAYLFRREVVEAKAAELRAGTGARP